MKVSATLLPQTREILETMGGQIKMARLRRRLPADLVAERASISRATLWSIEKGSPSVSIGAYAAVLHALNNMDKDLLLVAKDDELGRKLQDLNVKAPRRATRRNGVSRGRQKAVEDGDSLRMEMDRENGYTEPSET